MQVAYVHLDNLEFDNLSWKRVFDSYKVMSIVEITHETNLNTINSNKTDKLKWLNVGKRQLFFFYCLY